jgi:SAM-dependent methyltransferase
MTSGANHGPELTDPEYWSGIQRGLARPAQALRDDREAEWLAPVLRHLFPYAGQRFLELGCSPGHAAALIRSRVHLIMEGVDYNSEAALFHSNLAEIGCHDAIVHRADLRDFSPDTPYDVVASFGLIEHFSDPQTLLQHHLRLLRPGGLCVVVIPWFRGLQWLFHRTLDSQDLARHNLEAMDTDLFRRFASETGSEVLHLAHAGALRFWWSREPKNLCGRLALRIILTAAAKLRPHLRPGPLHSPWLVFIGRRSGS